MPEPTNEPDYDQLEQQKARLELEVFHAARDKLINWAKIYSTVIGVLVAIVSVIGLSSLVQTQVDAKIRERAELISASFTEVASGLTQQVTSVSGQSQRNLRDIENTIEVFREQINVLENSRTQLRNELDRVEALLAEDNAASLLKFLEDDFYGLKSISIQMGMCFIERSDAAEFAGLSTANFLPTLVFDDEVAAASEFFEKEITDRIEFYPESAGVGLIQSDGLFCNVRNYVPFAPFRRNFIGFDIRELPNIGAVKLRTPTLPVEFETGQNSLSEVQRSLASTEVFIAFVEFNGFSHRISISADNFGELDYDPQALSRSYSLSQELASPLILRQIAEYELD